MIPINQIPRSTITELLPNGSTRQREIINIPPGNAKILRLGYSNVICDESRITEIENQLANVLQCQQRDRPSSILDNVIASDFSDTIRKGDDNMASKYKERVKVGTNPDGSPMYAWACGNTKDELHRSIAAIISGLPTGKPNAPQWSDYAMDWFTKTHVPQVRAKTAEKESSLMRNHVAPAFPDMTLDMVSPETVQDYLATKSHYSSCQVRDIMQLMRQVFNCAVEDGYILKSPMDSSRVFNTSKKPEQERPALTAETQADIIAHLDDLTEPNARRLMAFLMFTPLRPCEIYGLQWSDIDRETMTIHVRRDLVFVNGKGVIDATKTKDSARSIPYDAQLQKYLEPYGSDGYIICMTAEGREGEHIASDSSLRCLWRRIGKTIDLHGMTPYTGRHTFATNMSRAGVPIKTAMAYLGHADERMLLRRYTHVNQSDMINANATMSNYIGGLANNL